MTDAEKVKHLLKVRDHAEKARRQVLKMSNAHLDLIKGLSGEQREKLTDLLTDKSEGAFLYKRETQLTHLEAIIDSVDEFMKGDE